VRAVEVLELTGRSIARLRDAPKRRPALPPFRGGIALIPPAAVAAARIERRFDAMLAAGVVEEVRAWRARPGAEDSPLAEAVGVREIAGHLDGKWSLAEARRATIVRVRRYAKRQRTWLRHRLGELERVSATGDELLAAARP